MTSDLSEKHFHTLSCASLGSGSKGNATLIRRGKTCVMLDCGFSLRETELRLLRRGLQPEDLSAIFVTHEHNDHVSGVGGLARQYNIPVYLTTGTWQAGRLSHVPRVELIPVNGTITVGDVTVMPIAVPHDANEPVQYVFQADGKSVGVLTDIGSITEPVIQHYAGCDALVLEANHCPDMLAMSNYPASLQQRVAGNWGHLSNEQAGVLLRRVLKPLKHLVLAHLSEQNNSPARVKDVLSHELKQAEHVLFANQRDGFDWITIE